MNRILISVSNRVYLNRKSFLLISSCSPVPLFQISVAATDFNLDVVILLYHWQTKIRCGDITKEKFRMNRTSFADKLVEQLLELDIYFSDSMEEVYTIKLRPFNCIIKDSKIVKNVKWRFSKGLYGNLCQWISYPDSRSLFLFSLSYVHACAGRFRGYKTCSGVASVPTSHSPVAQRPEETCY